MRNGHVARRLSQPHLPLRRMMLCLDCDECFEIGGEACPACGGETWVPVARLLDKNRKLAKPGPGQAPRYVVVVAHDQPVIYRQLAQMFAGDESFTVVMDRRRGDRRRGAGASGAKERRVADRRVYKPNAGLNVFGWVIARSDAGG